MATLTARQIGSIQYIVDDVRSDIDNAATYVEDQLTIRLQDSAVDALQTALEAAAAAVLAIEAVLATQQG